MVINHRAEIIAALRAEADRLEGGYPLPDCYSLKQGDDMDAHTLPEQAHAEAKRILDHSDDDTPLIEWGVFVKVCEARIVEREYNCACKEPYISTVVYGMVPLTHREPETDMSKYPVPCDGKCWEEE